MSIGDKLRRVLLDYKDEGVYGVHIYGQDVILINFDETIYNWGGVTPEVILLVAFHELTHQIHYHLALQKACLIQARRYVQPRLFERCHGEILPTLAEYGALHFLLSKSPNLVHLEPWVKSYLQPVAEGAKLTKERLQSGPRDPVEFPTTPGPEFDVKSDVANIKVAYFPEYGFIVANMETIMKVYGSHYPRAYLELVMAEVYKIHIMYCYDENIVEPERDFLKDACTVEYIESWARVIDAIRVSTESIKVICFGCPLSRVPKAEKERARIVEKMRRRYPVI
jgi:hypothetical protein